MSNERQRKLRLQGRYQPPKSSIRSVSQTMNSLRLGDDQQPLPTVIHELNANPIGQKLSYQKTNQQISPKFKSKGPTVINDCKELLDTWIDLSTSERGTSKIYYQPGFFDKEESDKLFTQIYQETKWENREVVIDGQAYPQPRQVHWIGPHAYKYSSLQLEPNDCWPESISYIRDCLKTVPGLERGFNSVLCNLYRNAKDSVAWHSDDELSMGVDPLIASVSFGETRKFQMKRKCKPTQSPSKLERAGQGASSANSLQDDDTPEWSVHLENGSLFIMDGTTQEDWLHRVPKEYHDREKRINLTFRTVRDLRSSK